MDSVSTPYVQDVIESFGKTREAAALSATDVEKACALAEATTNDIHNTIERHPLDVREGLRYAKRLGSLAGIFDALNIPQSSARITTLLAEVVSATSIPNRDIGLRQAVELHKRAAKGYLGANLPREAGICLTNAAAKLVGLQQETADDRAETLKLIECGYKLKNKSRDKIDIAFTLANMANARRKLAEFDGIAPEINYPKAWTDIQSSIKMFERNQDKEQPIHWTIFAILTDIVVSWVFYEADQMKSREPQVLTSLRIKERQYVLNLINSRIESSVIAEETADLRWHRYRLNDLMEHGNKLTYDVYVNAQYLWLKGDYETLIRRGRDFIQPPLVEDEKYLQFLTWITSALYEFRVARDNDDTKVFLQNNALTFRFAACSLAKLGHYEQAFKTLELSRGLSVPSQLDKIDVDAAISGNATFAHISHSADGIACLIANGLSGNKMYTGRFFDRDMDFFSRAFHEAALGTEPGLIVAQMKGDRVAAIRRAEEISESLIDIADYIFSECPPGRFLVIVPSGYFQSFPITSIVTSSGGTISEMRNSSIGPSVASQAASKFGFSMGDVSLVLADRVPGMAELKYSIYDRSAIARAGFKVETLIPERENLVSKDSSYRYLHFSGHSVSNPDPTKSSFALHSGEITAEDILKGKLDAEAVFLSSCQSGMALHMNDEWSEEVLSLQSAFFYRGASVVIGTSWPVLDSAAHVFTVLFYEHLPTASVSPMDWIVAFRSAQSRLRTITARELVVLLSRVGHFPADLPWYEVNPSSMPFSGFYHWAPFTLMVRN